MEPFEQLALIAPEHYAMATLYGLLILFVSCMLGFLFPKKDRTYTKPRK